jgi:hypothetical protein
LWEKLDVIQMMKCCIILHNMIVEEQSTQDPFLTDPSAQIIPNHCNPVLTHTLDSFLQNSFSLHDSVVHAQLRKDLKIHNWLLCRDQVA